MTKISTWSTPISMGTAYAVLHLTITVVRDAKELMPDHEAVVQITPQKWIQQDELFDFSRAVLPVADWVGAFVRGLFFGQSGQPKPKEVQVPR
jgi:hypothetical protein